jgi:hypothetical protein
VTQVSEPIANQTSEVLPARVVEQLIFLASAKSRQIDKVGGLAGPAIDLNDVAEDFENFTDAIWMSVEAGYISLETQRELKSLSRMLEDMSGPDNARLWLVSGLNAPEWDEVRRKAREILRSDDILDFISNPPKSAGSLIDAIRGDLPSFE